MRSSTSGTVRVGRVHIFLESSEWQKHAQHQKILKSYSENIWHYFDFLGKKYKLEGSHKEISAVYQIYNKKIKEIAKASPNRWATHCGSMKKNNRADFHDSELNHWNFETVPFLWKYSYRIKSSLCVFSKHPTLIIIINIRWCQISPKSDVLTWMSNKQMHSHTQVTF